MRNGRAAVDFYKEAFGAIEVYRFGGNEQLEEVVAQLAVGDAMFWVEDESPPHGNFSPESVGGATARMLLIVDDPDLVLARVGGCRGDAGQPCGRRAWLATGADRRPLRAPLGDREARG